MLNFLISSSIGATSIQGTVHIQLINNCLGTSKNELRLLSLINLNQIHLYH